MQQEAEILDTQIQHRKNELSAAQRKLDLLEHDFKEKTRLLVKEREDIILSKTKPLQISLIELQEKTLSQGQEYAEKATLLNDLDDDIDLTRKTLKDTRNELTVLQQERDTVQEKIQTGIKELQEHDKKKISLTEDIKTLEPVKVSLETEIEEIERKKKQAQRDFKKFDADYEDKRAEKEKKLQILDAKILERSVQIDQDKKSEDTIRSQFARERKALDDRDKNLRLREMKVEMGENKLIQNSDLLNL